MIYKIRRREVDKGTTMKQLHLFGNRKTLEPSNTYHARCSHHTRQKNNKHTDENKQNEKKIQQQTTAATLTSHGAVITRRKETRQRTQVQHMKQTFEAQQSTYHARCGRHTRQIGVHQLRRAT
jgi:hypothetical protein